MAECPKCGAELEKRLRPGDRCPECGVRTRDDDDDDDDDDRPLRRTKKKSGGAGKVLIILLLVGGIGAIACCGGGFALFYYLRGNEVEILDAGRQKTEENGTTSVTMNVRVGATRGANQVVGDYVFVAKSGTRTTRYAVSLRGQGGGEYRTTFNTSELLRTPGPVELWVEREDHGSSTRVSKSVTIP